MNDFDFLPPHAPTRIEGFHAYALQMRVRSGEVLEICATGEGVVQTAIVKLGASTHESTPVAQLSPFNATPQAIARGSYVFVERGIKSREIENDWTIEVWCRPFITPPRMGLLFQRDWFSLSLENGAPVLEIANARLSGEALELQSWHCIAARQDGSTLSLFVNGNLVAQTEAPRVSPRGSTPVLIGALENEKQQADDFWTGDLWSPAIYHRALQDEEIRARYENKTSQAAGNCIGHWKFDNQSGAPFRDVSSAGRNGRGVNTPQRMVPGPARIADGDWSSYDPNSDENFGHAIRLMADQFLDCRWPVALSWHVPEDIAPGQYAAHLENQAGEKREVYFLVVPKKPRAKLACFSTTNTRICYNFEPFGNAQLDYGAYGRHPGFPLLAHLIGFHRPNSGEPWTRQTVDWELPFYAWLEREGIAYDLYSEWDLEENPDLLDDYQAAACAGHSEYWTKNQYETLRKFNARGGHLLSFSGNTAYWRVSLDFDNRVLEVRKHTREKMEGTDCDSLLNAAHHHQMDGLPGGILREDGWPEHDLLGVATIGSTNPPLDGPRAGYEILAPQNALFHSPRKIETTFPFAPDAAGYECDISIRRHLELFGEFHAPHYPPRSGKGWPKLDDDFNAGLTILARAKIPDSNILDYDNHFFLGEMESEIILWQRPNFGTVFCIGSVTCGEVLLRDENFSNFVLNVLESLGF